jgi:polysaccharide biosynthesis/export protein
VSFARRLGTTLSLASLGLIAGCFSSNPADIEAFIKPYETNVTAESYILQPPDEIEVHCAQVPEVHLQRQRIRPDGKVSFEGIGEVEVAGKTPAEVTAVLQGKISKLYALQGDHPVDVRIAAYASKVYYVLGQVLRAGPMTYTGRDSVLTALAINQPNPLAWEQRVQVIRPAATEDVAPRIFEVNYEKMIVHGDTSKDVLLEAGDIVYVPPTILASIGLVIEEIITPVARAFYGWYLVQNPPVILRWAATDNRFDDVHLARGLNLAKDESMTTRRWLKLIHVASTIWIIVCISYIFVLTLHSYGFNWWLIFSLSGHSVIAVFVLVSLYLFALFRGVGGAQQIAVEHPFTSTASYMVFYVAAPLLGGLAGIVGMIGSEGLARCALGIALGTLGTAFCVWVILDPVIGMLEMLQPASRMHRAERLARAEAARKARQQRRERLLVQVTANEEQEQEQWRQTLLPQAQRLAALLADDTPDPARAQQEAVDIGAQAWRLGGLTCMRQLRDMTMAIIRQSKARVDTDYVSYWWDGIGDWRRPSLG